MKTPAERQKLWRTRQALGLVKANVWAPPELVEYFILMRAITEAEALDPDELGDAVLKWVVMQAEEVRGRKFA